MIDDQVYTGLLKEKEELNKRIDQLNLEKDMLKGSLLQLQSDYKNSVSKSIVDEASCRRDIERCNDSISMFQRAKEKELSEKIEMYERVKKEDQDYIINIVNKNQECQRENNQLHKEINKFNEIIESSNKVVLHHYDALDTTF